MDNQNEQTDQLPIPHRPPFLFVDQVISRTEKELKATKHFTGTEDFYKGHFPSFPLTPGVILCEALFQTGALLLSDRKIGNQVGVICKIDSFKFRRPVFPDTHLVMTVQLKEQMGNLFLMEGKVESQGKAVCSGKFWCKITSPDELQPEKK